MPRPDPIDPDPQPMSELAEKRVFGLARVAESIHVAFQAGKGYDRPLHPPTAGPDVTVWTLLQDHPTVEDDYAFLSEFSPDRVIDELYRKADLIKIGNERMVTLLIQQWVDHPDFPDRWRLDEPPADERVDNLLFALEQAEAALPNNLTPPPFIASTGGVNETGSSSA